MVALRDAHIVAATQPVALEAPQLGGVFNLSDGIVRVYGGLKRGQRYTAYSYAPRPEPAQLARRRARLPAGARPLPPDRSHARRAVRRRRTRRARRPALR